jgi:hypothetical protein
MSLVLQIDYISRLMWQAQLRGHKMWKLVPPPDCDHICSGISFRVEPGDIGKLTVEWRSVCTLYLSIQHGTYVGTEITLYSD